MHCRQLELGVVGRGGGHEARVNAQVRSFDNCQMPRDESGEIAEPERSSLLQTGTA
jgi:hypothetical protein